MKINDMKRSISFILLAGIMTAACINEADWKDKGDGAIHHAYIQEVDTRTGFDSYDGKFSWTTGDQIAIHMSDGTWQTTTVNAKTGAFQCESSKTSHREGYAVYPATIYDPDNIGDPVLNIILPDEYDITGKLNSELAPLPMVAVNSEEESDLYFCHVGGLLRITCNAVPAGTRRIAVTLDRNIAGTFTVSRPESSAPSISSGGSTNTVSFIISENGLSDKTDGIVLSLPVPTGTYSSLTVTPYDGNGDAIDTFDRTIGLPVVRQMGKKLRFSLEEVITDSMQLIVTAGDETGWTYTLPFNRYANFPASLEIDWGDGATSSVSKDANVESCYNDITHSYTSAGDYTITITGTGGKKGLIPHLYTWNVQEDWDNGYDKMLKSVPTPLLKMNVDNEYNSFCHCYGLQTICADLFSKNPQLKHLSHTFHNCHRLQEIPAGLFDSLLDIESFSGVFKMETWTIHDDTPVSGRLSSGIPSGLFDHNTNVCSFSEVFYGCDGIPSIPDNLFYYNTEVESFYGVFEMCSGITGSIPSNLFVNNRKVRDFGRIFDNCSGFTGPIPSDLFSNQPEVDSFEFAFCDCSGLTEDIPSDLFANNTKVTDFSGVLSGCSGLEGDIPENLFANQHIVTSFYRVFSGCSGLTGSIPNNLFATNPDVTNFSEAFCGCTNLSGTIPSVLFSRQNKVTNFYYTFGYCPNLSGEIPHDLFETNPDVTTFNSLFMGCTGLYGSIPGDLFSHQQNVTSFGQAFWGCTGLTGSIPGSLFTSNEGAEEFWGTFCDCTGLTGTIPANLFSQQRDAYCFYGTFSNCSGLTGLIPSSLFENNPKAYNFGTCFSNCSKLKVNPDLFGDSNRFESMTDQCRFENCFYKCGTALPDGGTAPELWTYTFGNGVDSYGCFKDATTLSNYNDIDSAWK